MTWLRLETRPLVNAKVLARESCGKASREDINSASGIAGAKPSQLPAFRFSFVALFVACRQTQIQLLHDRTYNE